MRREAVTVAVTATLWLLAVCGVLLPLPFVGTYVGLAAGILTWLVIVGAVVLVGVLVGRRRWLTVTATGLTLLLAAVLLNWSSVAPAAWFDTHRSLYERAARHVVDVGAGGYDGVQLPVALRPLSADGRVRTEGSMLFFPQWLGIPDDAGGYFYSPGGSPQGADMLGLICREPESLGDDWWVCGM